MIWLILIYLIGVVVTYRYTKIMKMKMFPHQKWDREDVLCCGAISYFSCIGLFVGIFLYFFIYGFKND